MDTLLVNNQLLSWRISGESNIILSLKFRQDDEGVCPNQGMQYFRPKSISALQRDRQRQEDYWKSGEQDRQGGHAADFTAGTTYGHVESDSCNTFGGVEGKDSGIATNLSSLNCDIHTSSPKHSSSIKRSCLGVHAANNTMSVETTDAKCGSEYFKTENYTQSDNIVMRKVKTQTDCPKGIDKGNLTKKIKFIHNQMQTDLKEYSETSCNTEWLAGENKETNTYHPSRHIQTIAKPSSAKSTMTVSFDKNMSTNDSCDLDPCGLDDNISQNDRTTIDQQLPVDIYLPSSLPLTEPSEPEIVSPEPGYHQLELQEISDTMAKIVASTERRKARLAYYKAKSGIT
jgi:hypothetical protein